MMNQNWQQAKERKKSMESTLKKNPLKTSLEQDQCLVFARLVSMWLEWIRIIKYIYWVTFVSSLLLQVIWSGNYLGCASKEFISCGGTIGGNIRSFSAVHPTKAQSQIWRIHLSHFV